VSNLTITGGGVIDGNGHRWWGCLRKDDWANASPPCGDDHGVYHSRPHLVMVVRSSDVNMTDLTARDSPNWTLHFAGVKGLLVANNSVHSPSDAPNTDGINLDCTQNAVVEDNYVAVGDDALCVKSGINHLGRTFGQPSRNIVFRRNTISTGHGITIGSEMSAGVSNVTFEDIIMDQTNVGIRLKSQRGRGGVVHDVTYRNIHKKSIDEECVQVTLNYDANGPPSTDTQTNATATPAFQNIAFENVLCEHGGKSYFLDASTVCPSRPSVTSHSSTSPWAGTWAPRNDASTPLARATRSRRRAQAAAQRTTSCWQPESGRPQLGDGAQVPNLPG
jgi:polygalacturonase